MASAQSFKDDMDAAGATGVFVDFIKIGRHFERYLESGGMADYVEWGVPGVRKGKGMGKGRDECENESKGKDKSKRAARISTPTVRTIRSTITRLDDFSMAAADH